MTNGVFQGCSRRSQSRSKGRENENKRIANQQASLHSLHYSSRHGKLNRLANQHDSRIIVLRTFVDHQDPCHSVVARGEPELVGC